MCAWWWKGVPRRHALAVSSVSPRPGAADWVNNCIGSGNYRAFLQMCFYLNAACLHAASLLLAMDAHLVTVALGWDEGSRLLAAAGGSSGSSGSIGEGAQAAASGSSGVAGWALGPFWAHAAVQVAATALVLPLAAALLTLLAWNGYLALRNLTTIEFHEGALALSRVQMNATTKCCRLPTVELLLPAPCPPPSNPPRPPPPHTHPTHPGMQAW